MKDSLDQFTKTSIFLHWFVGSNIIVMMTLGFLMVEAKVYWLYPIHKSVGTLLTVFILWRVARRIRMGFPPALGYKLKSAIILAKTNQSLMLFSSVMMPVTGIAMSIASGRGLYVFDFALYDASPDPVNMGKFIPISKELASIANNTHALFAWLFLFMISVHVIAAMKHHYYYHDSTLKRMLGKKIKPYESEAATQLDSKNSD